MLQVTNELVDTPVTKQHSDEERHTWRGNRPYIKAFDERRVTVIV